MMYKWSLGDFNYFDTLITPDSWKALTSSTSFFFPSISWTLGVITQVSATSSSRLNYLPFPHVRNFLISYFFQKVLSLK